MLEGGSWLQDYNNLSIFGNGGTNRLPDLVPRLTILLVHKFEIQ